MSEDERVKVLEDRVAQLQAELKKLTHKTAAVSFQRMIDDGRGRGMVVTVGGNNGGY